MALLIAYDRFLHDKLMNPAFRWVQKLFHWNRFQLIRAFALVYLMANVILPAIYVIMAGHQQSVIVGVAYLVFAAAMISVFLRQIPFYLDSRVFDSLHEASRQFENGHRVSLPAVVIGYAHGVREHRLGFNGVATFNITCWVAFFPVTDMIAVYTATNVLSIALFIEAHLWDIDDIDPKDREYLFEGKRSKKPAN